MTVTKGGGAGEDRWESSSSSRDSSQETKFAVVDTANPSLVTTQERFQRMHADFTDRSYRLNCSVDDEMEAAECDRSLLTLRVVIEKHTS